MNTQRSPKKKYENVMPEVDEGWWESVLAEENQYSLTHQGVLGKHETDPTDDEQRDDHKETETHAEVQNVTPLDWDMIRKLYLEDSVVGVNVTGHNRGGLLVESEGLAGFIPFSHLVDLAGREYDDRDECLEEYTGRTIKVKVIECVPEDGRVVFSERAALTPPGKRSELFHELHPGSQVTGTVTNVTDFGVFVDLGGVEGLIHLSELSWGRVTHPKDIVQLGGEIRVQVLEVSVERNRVALSLKRLIPNPWENAESNFPIARVLPAVITTVLSYGAFARLDVGVEGLIHASEMPLAENQSPRDILQTGQEVQVRVIHVEPAHQRLGLSLQINNG